MKFSETLHILEKFDEGCELTDVVQNLLQSAYALNGFDEEIKAEIILLIAKELIKEYLDCVIEYGTLEEFDMFDSDIFKLLKSIDKNDVNFIERE